MLQKQLIKVFSKIISSAAVRELILDNAIEGLIKFEEQGNFVSFEGFFRIFRDFLAEHQYQISVLS